MNSRILRDTRGAVATVFGMMLVPLLVTTGAAVDFARLGQFKADLQAVTDSAALAGARVYSGGGTKDDATLAVANYFTNAYLPPNISRGTATPTFDATDKTANNYTVTVTVTGATIQPTFMSLFYPSGLAVSTSATAANPTFTANISLKNFSSSAADLNQVYYYIVPKDGSNPPTTDFTSDNLMYSNASTAGPPRSTIAVTFTSGSKLGFVLSNTTGGNTPYGNNGYGAAQGSVHWFYSSSKTISTDAYPGVSQDCALQTIQWTSSSAPTAPLGSCYDYSSKPYSFGSLDCLSQANSSQSFEFAYNDMGGGQDDKDYNDAVFSVQCPAYNANPPKLALVE